MRVPGQRRTIRSVEPQPDLSVSWQSQEASERTAAKPTVVIYGEDLAVGRALEVLLKSAHYNARFVAESSLEQSGALEEARVILLAPSTSPKNREDVLAKVKSMPKTARISVLEMGIAGDGSVQVDPERYIPWPCRTVEIKRWINVALLTET